MKNLFHNVKATEGSKVNVIIEVPFGSRNKYEYDKEMEALVFDRLLHSPFFYPVNYGFVPNTWYDDDDPIDAMVLGRYSLHPLTVVKTRVIGMLRMRDEKGIDDKLLCVPVDDPSYKDYKDVNDVPKAILDEIAHFFERYKDLEKGKHVKVEGWLNAETALKALEKAKQMYADKF